MRLAQCLAVILAVAFVSALSSPATFAQEEGRPAARREAPGRDDAERRGANGEKPSEEMRRLLDRKAEEARKLEELNKGRPEGRDEASERRPTEQRVTNVDEVAKTHDLTKPPSAEFHDVDKLRTELKDEDSKKVELKDMRRVYGDNRADDIAKKLGYNDAHDLKQEFKANSRSDIFIDKNNDVYLGNKSGEGDAEFVGKLRE